jgi:nitrous oxidase accessory protein
MNSLDKLCVLVITITLLTALNNLPNANAATEHKTIFVPDDYATLQEAIDNANSWDIVHVKAGTFQEVTLQIDKPLSIIGEGKEQTYIKLNPPLVNYTLIYVPLTAHSVAITIRSNDVKISGLTFNLVQDRYSYMGGLSADGDRIEISNCEIDRSGENGHTISGSFSCFVNNSIANSLAVNGSNQTITNNSITGNLESQGAFNQISQNQISQSVEINGDYNLINGNTMSQVILQSSNYNFISNNSLEHLEIGAFGKACVNNTCCKNLIIGPTFTWGIQLGSCLDSIFYYNLIANYTGYGVAMGNFAVNNMFYHNLFINNDRDVAANWPVNESVNSWDNGKEGNYWSKYKGTDNNGDGIGDNPFRVEGIQGTTEGSLVNAFFGQDNYPLITKINLEKVMVKLPDWAKSLFNDSYNLSQDDPVQTDLPITAIIGITLSVVTIVTLTGVLLNKKVHSKRLEN